MATYYIDADNGSDAAAGTHPTISPWLTLDKFTESARSAGDVAILRGGMTNGYDNGSDLDFTSDGTIVAPIVIEADYDDAWGDHVDISGTATATLTFGSKTITFSADVSGVIAVGDIIYVDGENNREFAYEVASVSTTTVTLYLPYKGNEAGSGKTVINMQNPPHWNDAASDNFGWNFDTDNYWKIQGVLIRGTKANAGEVEIDSCLGHQFIDCIFIGNGAADHAITLTDDTHYLFISKCRSYNNQSFIRNQSDAYGTGFIKNCFIDGNSVASATFLTYASTMSYTRYIEECEVVNVDTSFDMGSSSSVNNVFGRNNLLAGSSAVITAGTGMFGKILLEDYNGTLGDNRVTMMPPNNSNDTYIYQSETTIVRTGGSNRSIKVTPTTSISNNWEYSRLMVFELPIYATTDPKTYTVYFRTEATANWTADPTASELWIELEAWGHATNNFRKITKSTGVIDFNGSTAWQSLTVTVAPAQAGVAYLRCWYAKTKEAQSNVFYVDPIPVIS